ncbi:MAG: RHS repeat-associated core domain-containing protein [Patescibacteria group bacterium]
MRLQNRIITTVLLLCFVPVHLTQAGDELIATVEKQGTSPEAVYYDHTDHLGGSSVLTNASAVAEQVLDYYPFGGIRLNEKASSFDEQRKFTGQEYDKDTNLHYYVQRYYNQDVGRFTSQDPVHLLIGDEQRFKDKAQRSLEFHLSDPQSLNSYSYVNNNPLKYVDETGEIWQYIAAALFWPEVAYAPATPEETYNDPTEKVLLIGSFVPFGGGVKNVPNTVKNLTDDAVSIIAKNREAGALGEKAAGIIKNTEKIPSVTNPGTNRIPDVLDHGSKTIGDVKNTNYQPFTAQLKDIYAHAQNISYDFKLIVDQRTQISKTLQQLGQKLEVIRKDLNNLKK